MEILRGGGPQNPKFCKDNEELNWNFQNEWWAQNQKNA